MLYRVLDSLAELPVEEVRVVVGYRAEQVRATLSSEQPTVGTSAARLSFAEQRQQLGTGHAVQIALDASPAVSSEHLMVLPGDAPLLRPGTIHKLYQDSQMGAHIAE